MYSRFVRTVAQHSPVFCKIVPESGHKICHDVIHFVWWRVFKQLITNGEQILQLVRVHHPVILSGIAEYSAKRRASSVRKVIIINR